MLPPSSCCAVAGDGGGDYGSADDFESFKRLAAHLNNHAAAHEALAEQELYNMGVAPCPCCRTMLPFVGSTTSGWAAHVRKMQGTSSAHATFAATQQHGWEAERLAELQRRVDPASAAGYHMAVVRTRAGRGQPRPAETARAERWRQSMENREARTAQEEARASRAERGGGAEALRQLAGRLGGQAAVERGQRQRETAPERLEMDWSWLDSIDARFIHELDVLVSRQCLPELRREYLHMLHHGLEYALQYVGRDDEGGREARGWKFVVLAKAVTTGRLRAEASRSVREIRGRIRFVNEGKLRQLAEELFEDAVAERRAAEAEAAAAAAARGAEARRMAAPSGAQAARARAEATLVSTRWPIDR